MIRPLSERKTHVTRDRIRRLAVACSLALAVAAIDQGTKALAIAELSTRERIPLIGDLLGLQLAFNPGTVMSLGSGSTWVFTTISALASVALLFAAFRTASVAWAVVVGFIWGGAVGNFSDRLLAAPGFGRGYVTDFLAYGELFIGNLADVALGIGVGLGIIQFLRHRSDQPRSKAARASDEARQHVES